MGKGRRGDGETARAGRDGALIGEPGDLEDLEEVGGGQAGIPWDGRWPVDIVFSAVLFLPGGRGTDGHGEKCVSGHFQRQGNRCGPEGQTRHHGGAGVWRSRAALGHLRGDGEGRETLGEGRVSSRSADHTGYGVYWGEGRPPGGSGAG